MPKGTNDACRKADKSEPQRLRRGCRAGIKRLDAAQASKRLDAAQASNLMDAAQASELATDFVILGKQEPDDQVPFLSGSGRLG